MSSAAGTVLSTFELLDLIVSYLDWQTALTAQSVSHLWHDVINTGTRVQHNVGLKALSRRQHWMLRINGIGVFEGAGKISPDEAIPDSGRVIVVQCKATAPWAEVTTSTLSRIWTTLWFGTEYVFKLQALPPAWLTDQSPASWRHMQLTQPPSTTAYMSTRVYIQDRLMYRRERGHKTMFRIQNSAGITIGDVMVVVRQWTAAAPSAVDWAYESFVLELDHMIDDTSFFRALCR